LRHVPDTILRILQVLLGFSVVVLNCTMVAALLLCVHYLQRPWAGLLLCCWCVAPKCDHAPKKNTKGSHLPVRS
jgi:hypothetical protein